MPISESMQHRLLIAIAVVAAGFIHISIAVSQFFLGLGTRDRLGSIFSPMETPIQTNIGT